MYAKIELIWEGILKQYNKQQHSKPEKFFKGLIEVMVCGTAIHLRLLVNKPILIKRSHSAFQWVFSFYCNQDNINLTYDELNE